MAGHGQKLTRKRELVISALLLKPTIASAAKAAGVGESTVLRWLQREDFQNRYREARREAVGQAVARLSQVCGEAVETLREILKNPEAPASSRVSASKTVLDIALKSVELEEISRRIEALEQAVIGKEGG